jgi:hypothetical protein
VLLTLPGHCPSRRPQVPTFGDDAGIYKQNNVTAPGRWVDGDIYPCPTPAFHVKQAPSHGAGILSLPAILAGSLLYLVRLSGILPTPWTAAKQASHPLKAKCTGRLASCNGTWSGDLEELSPNPSQTSPPCSSQKSDNPYLALRFRLIRQISPAANHVSASPPPVEGTLVKMSNGIRRDSIDKRGNTCLSDGSKRDCSVDSGYESPPMRGQVSRQHMHEEETALHPPANQTSWSRTSGTTSLTRLVLAGRSPCYKRSSRRRC